MIIDIKDLDCIFLTYTEPDKEKFWTEIKTIVPWVTRVDGIKGSDAAHKAAAAASNTERFILIDGDNIPSPVFFTQSLTLNENNVDCVFRWRARNSINGLVYGNGGISSWTKTHINNMRTHENSNGSNETCVEFCFDSKYIPLWNCYSTTYPNQSLLQAWRAGFREGVKMCLDRGRRVAVSEFINMRSYQNLEYLNIWHTVGNDVKHGSWAIYGARYGTYKVMLDQTWDYTLVQDFDAIDNIFNTEISVDFEKRRAHYHYITGEIKNKLKIPVVEMGAEQSAFFKKFYNRLHRNRDIMSP